MKLDSIKILEQLILKTSSGAIKWVETFGFINNYNTYRYTLRLTDKKTLEFNLFVYRDIQRYSYLTIYFNKDNTKSYLKEYISTMQANVDFLLYDLIQSIVENKTSVL